MYSLFFTTLFWMFDIGNKVCLQLLFSSNIFIVFDGNSSKTLIGVSNHFLIGFNDCFRGQNSCLVRQTWPKTHIWMVLEPMKEYSVFFVFIFLLFLFVLLLNSFILCICTYTNRLFWLFTNRFMLFWTFVIEALCSKTWLIYRVIKCCVVSECSAMSQSSIPTFSTSRFSTSQKRT